MLPILCFRQRSRDPLASVDAKCGDDFPQADFSGPIRLARGMDRLRVLGHARGCFDTGLHIVAPQRSEHEANEPVAAAKWHELVGPADHCATAVGSERSFSTHAVYEAAKHNVREACHFVSEAMAGGVLGEFLSSRRTVGEDRIS